MVVYSSIWVTAKFRVNKSVGLSLPFFLRIETKIYWRRFHCSFVTINSSNIDTFVAHSNSQTNKFLRMKMLDYILVVYYPLKFIIFKLYIRWTPNRLSLRIYIIMLHSQHFLKVQVQNYIFNWSNSFRFKWKINKKNQNLFVQHFWFISILLFYFEFIPPQNVNCIFVKRTFKKNEKQIYFVIALLLLQ